MRPSTYQLFSLRIMDWMANSQKQAEQLLDVMRDAAGRCGLEMNALKSKCMISNYRGAPIELLKGMEVVEHHDGKLESLSP